MRGQRFLHTGAYLRRYPIRLAAGAIFRNEARYLPEWIEFHLRQGVERFYLYENNSTDDWERALAPYQDVVETTRWTDHPGQMSAYTDCIERYRRDTRWLALIDIDEFLFSPTGQSLPDVLRRFRSAGEVVVNCRVYGTSGHEYPPDVPIIEAYTRRAVDEHPMNQLVKSIVFPAVTALPAHHPHYCLSYGTMVDERGKRVPPKPQRTPPTADVLRINHYVTRSRSEWYRKLVSDRADVREPREPLDLDELNAVEDKAAVATCE